MFIGKTSKHVNAQPESRQRLQLACAQEHRGHLETLAPSFAEIKLAGRIKFGCKDRGVMSSVYFWK
jgi:hypothetical protein